MLGKVTDKNCIMHEFIGLQTLVLDSPDDTLKNRTGVIVDESMNTFTLEYHQNGKPVSIIVPKHTTKFRFSIPKSRNELFQEQVIIDVNGSDLTKRPEDRIKRLAKLANQIHKKKNQN